MPVEEPNQINPVLDELIQIGLKKFSQVSEPSCKISSFETGARYSPGEIALQGSSF